MRRWSISIPVLALAFTLSGVAEQKPAPAPDEQDKPKQGRPGERFRPGGPEGRRFGGPPPGGPQGRPFGGPPPWEHGPGQPPFGRAGGGPRHHPFPRWFDDLANMSPEDREHALQDNPRFQKLPPERQEEIRKRLQHYSEIPPERRAQMRERWDVMESLTPEGRQKIREVFPRWRGLEPERRKAVGDEFRALRGMTAAERERRLASPEFQKTFSPEEQQVLKDLSALLRPDKPEAKEQ